MKRIYFLIIAILILSDIHVEGQLLPIFTQKLSDGVIMDPSLAGYSGGSAVFGLQKQWSNVNGSPQYYYMGAHTRFGQDKMGIGMNVFLEESNILENYYISIPIAYHLPVNKTSGISFGLAPELTMSQLNRDNLIVQDYSDPILLNYDDKLYLDFSFGMNFHHTLFQIGASVSRMMTMMQYEEGNSNPLGGYLTAYSTLFLKLRNGKDRLEPMVVYRNQNNAPDQWDISLFYFMSQGIILGVSYRTEDLIGISAGYTWKERVVIGYTYEMLIGEYSGTAGGSHELVCRYNFNKQFYEKSQRFNTRPRSSITTKKKGKR